jgi:hypothetical protein
VVHEVGVERVVRGDEDASAPCPARPARPGLLPDRRDGARPAGEDDRVEARDVEPELERVRGGDADELARLQLPLELSPLLGQVAGAVGRHLPTSSGAAS